jgi:glycosyltransferase involved in cell wall biosynthesis
VDTPRLATVPRFSVIVCTYTDERWSDLCATVASVAGQDPPPLEVIVVVDHNRGLFERVRRALTDVTTVENDERRGLSGARNSGVRVARGDIVAFIDDDATAEPGWLAGLAAAYAGRSVMAAGGAIWPAWDIQRPGWFPEEFDWVVGCSYRGLPETRAEVRNLIGCNMSFRREVFDEIGGFAHEVGRIGTRPLGGEETELCIRLRRRRPESRVIYEPSAAVRHRVPAIRTTLGYFRSRCYAEGLSKAAIARFAGAADATRSERRYATHVLGKGVVRNLGAMVAGRDWDAGRRSVAIVFGLAVTTAGYLVASVVRPTPAPGADE